MAKHISYKYFNLEFWTTVKRSRRLEAKFRKLCLRMARCAPQIFVFHTIYVVFDQRTSYLKSIVYRVLKRENIYNFHGNTGMPLCWIRGDFRWKFYRENYSLNMQIQRRHSRWINIFISQTNISVDLIQIMIQFSFRNCKLGLSVVWKIMTWCLREHSNWIIWISEKHQP